MSRDSSLRQILCASTALAMTAWLAPVSSALTVRDDVTVAGSEAYADDPKWDGAVQIYLEYPDGSIFFNCSGTLINPRTVISAAHCFNEYSSTVYGMESGQIAPIVAYGPDTFDALFGWLDAGAATTRFEFDERTGLVFANQVIIHPDADPAFGNPLDFPGADVSLISLSSPLANIPSYAMLFSPVEAGEHVSMVGYGSHGIGSTGDVGIDGKRQAGENILGMVGSQNDFVAGIFQADQGPYSGVESNQALYWIDFDQPDRTGEECSRDETFGDYVCDGAQFFVSYDGKYLLPGPAIDYFPGDALPYESGTAGGDSGSAIFFDQLGDQPLIGGVLSGGFSFTTPIPSGYGDVSYYNPLFNFYDFISVANPYKYVSAQAGDGNWSDATHWVQDLDPGYFIIDADGNLVNGLPDSPEPGVLGTGPTSGTVIDTPISSSAEASATTVASGDSLPEANFSSTSRPASGLVSLGLSGSSDIANGSVFGPSQEGFGDLSYGALATGEADLDEEPELITYLYGDVGTPGPLTGPGATDFVPNNGLNSAGFYNYFDVTLDQPGTTTVDVGVEVDRLTIANTNTVLDITSDNYLLAILDTKVYGGVLNNDGSMVSRDILNYGGMLTGSGVFVADTIWNAGILAPTTDAETGFGMEIYGDLVLTSASAFGYSGTSLYLDGDLSADGVVLFGTAYAYGDQGTLIEYTGSAVGGFDNTDLAGVLFASYDIGGGLVSFTIDAANFSTELGGISDPNILGVASALDGARETFYSRFTDIYGQVDYLSGDELASAFSNLLPDTNFSIRNVMLAGSEQVNTHLSRRFNSISAGKADGMAVNQSGTYGIQTASSDAMSAFAMSAEAAADADVRTNEGWGSFVEIAYYTGDETNSLTGAGSDIDGTSITAGADAQIDEGLRLGGFFNYSDGGSSASISTGKVDSSGFLVGAYGSYAFSNAANLSGYVGVGEAQLDITRVEGLTGSLMTGDTEASQSVGGVTLAGLFRTNGALSFEPSVGVEYYAFDVSAYDEAGGTAALRVEDQRLSSTQAHIGTLVHFFDPTGDAQFRPTLGIRYVHDFAQGEDSVRAGFNGAPGNTFTTVSGGSDDSWFEADARVQFVKTGDMEVNGFVSQIFDRDDVEYTAFGLNVKKTF